jgi:hypothetical protein
VRFSLALWDFCTAIDKPFIYASSAATYGDGSAGFEDDVPDLYHNERDGNFTFRTFDAKLGSNLKYLGWGGGFFDYDNDGWPDLFIANGHVYPELENHHHAESPYRQRNLLYHNSGNGRFEDVSSAAGPGLELRRSGRGVAFGDRQRLGERQPHALVTAGCALAPAARARGLRQFLDLRIKARVDVVNATNDRCDWDDHFFSRNAASAFVTPAPRLPRS